MSHLMISAKHRRPLTALLLMGSMMGFAMGQVLGHPAGKAPAQPVTMRNTTLHAAGNIGAKPLSLPMAQSVTPPALFTTQQDHAQEHKSDHGDHHDHHKSQDNQNGGGD